MVELLSGTAIFGSLRQDSHWPESMSQPRPSCNSSMAKVVAPSQYLLGRSGSRTSRWEPSGVSTPNVSWSPFRNRMRVLQRRLLSAAGLSVAVWIHGQELEKQSEKKRPKD